MPPAPSALGLATPKGNPFERWAVAAGRSAGYKIRTLLMGSDPMPTLEMSATNDSFTERNALIADSDEVAQAFRYDCAQDSDLKPPSPRSLAGR